VASGKLGRVFLSPDYYLRTILYAGCVYLLPRRSIASVARKVPTYRQGKSLCLFRPVRVSAHGSTARILAFDIVAACPLSDRVAGWQRSEAKKSPQR